MSKKSISMIEGEMMNDAHYYSLKELCEACNVHAEFVMELVAYGILEPKGKKINQWQFSIHHLKKSKSAARLQRDLELNLPGVALALDLLEQLDQLHSRINLLEQQLTIFERHK